MQNYVGRATIMVSGVKTDIAIWVNKDGNLELQGIGIVNYKLEHEKLTLTSVVK